MIKLYGRMVPAVARGLAGNRREGPMPATVALASRFRVWPHDIDINRHLNNGRYLQLIDVNRIEWLLRTGIIDFVRRNRWKPILGSTAIHFRRELRLWETAVASTRLIGWDDRWAYLEHRIDTPDGRCVAIAMARAGFRSRGRWMSIESLRAALPHRLPDMDLPAHALAWAALDAEFGGLVGPGRRELAPSPGDLPDPAPRTREFAR